MTTPEDAQRVVEIVAEAAGIWPAVDETPDYMPADRRDELLRNAVIDARKQILAARGEARLFRARSTDPDVAGDRAEKQWRENWPGLAALVDGDGG